MLRSAGWLMSQHLYGWDGAILVLTDRLHYVHMSMLSCTFQPAKNLMGIFKEYNLSAPFNYTNIFQVAISRLF